MNLRLIVILLLLCSSAVMAQIRITSPNGGETFKAGSKIVIQWTGVLATDTVTLEFSSDDGTTWTAITNSATGLQYTWVGIPTTPSASCLIRATHTTTGNNGTIRLFGNGNYGNATFSADGNLVLGASSDGNAYIWDSHSTQLLHTFQTESGTGIPGMQALNFWGIFSPDMKTFATVSPSTDAAPFGNMIRIFDASSGVKLHEWHLDNTPDGVHTSGMCRFSPDGTSIASTGKDSIYVWNIASGNVTSRLSGFVKQEGFSAEYRCAVTLDWNPNGADILGGIGFYSDSIPSYIRANATTGDTVQTYTITTTVPFFTINEMVHYSPDGTKFIASTDDTAVRVWDVASGKILWKIRPGLRAAVDAVFSHDGSTVATIGYDSLGGNSYNIKLWDAATGSFIKWVGSVGFASKTIEFSPDDSRLLISSVGQNVIFQNPTGGVESDVSDGTFTIIPNNGENIVVYTPNSSGHINDNIDIPVLIDDPSGAVAAGATSVTFTLTHNVTMLDPIQPTPTGTVTGSDRITNFTLPINPTDTVLTVLHYRVALGTDSVTTLAIGSPTTNAPTVTATHQDGIFTLLDMCYAGGPRLLNPNGTVTMNVLQNPATDGITVGLNLIENGQTTLTLNDESGRVVVALINEDIKAGARTIFIPPSLVPSGFYFLRLCTPNNTLVSSVEVRR